MKMFDYAILIIFVIVCLLLKKKKRLMYQAVIKRYNQNGWEFKNNFCKNKSDIISYFEELKNNGEIEDYKVEFDETFSKELIQLPYFYDDDANPWYYNFRDKLLYPYKVPVAQPQREADIEKDFNMSIQIAYYDEDFSYGETIEEFEKRLLEEYIQYRAERTSDIAYNIKIANNGKNCDFEFAFSEEGTKLKEFISDIEENDYTILYSYLKDVSLQVWEIDKNNIRIFIEETNKQYAEITLLFDVIVSKDKFISELKKVQEQVECKIKEAEANYIPNNEDI